MIKRPINSIVYCNKFEFTPGEVQTAGNDIGPSPVKGRVYQSHYDTIKDRYFVLVKNKDKSIVFTFDGDSGSNTMFDYDFTEVTSRNIETLAIESEEDIDLINKFMNEIKGKDIDIMDAEALARIEEGHEIDEEGVEDEMEVSFTDEALEAAEEEVNRILAMTDNQVTRIESAVKAMNLMIRKDPVFAKVLQDLMIYLGSTYSDKYHKSPIATKGIIYHEAYGKGFNIGNSTKYLARYLTEGFEKSNMPKDLNKAIHYCLFELARRDKHGK